MEAIVKQSKLPFEERPSVFRAIILCGIVSLAALEFFMTAYDHAHRVESLGISDWLLFGSIAFVILFAGTARAMIVIQTPHVRQVRIKHSDDSIRDVNRADAWMYVIAGASAAYIGFLCYRVDALTVDLMVMMQIANMILLGLEWFYSQLTMARLQEAKENQEEDTRLSHAERAAEEATAEFHRAKDQLENSLSELEEKNQELLAISPAATAMQKLIGKGVFSAGGGSNAAVCPDCFELATAGPASKSITCSKHGVIAKKDQDGNWKINAHDRRDSIHNGSVSGEPRVGNLLGEGVS